MDKEISGQIFYYRRLRCWHWVVFTSHRNMVVVQVHKKKKSNQVEAEIL
ncbi:hypothetical protein Patl1_24557 [Pistacia atlantica]|uniref:Uncharacterized protein n=1 Tax=Pistacia atlantica TaxID=434234 RepID=A0ACC1A3T8_9ROSI|nr:hypothetical protein Patl1_24557 [Pistacia atlantica]